MNWTGAPAAHEPVAIRAFARHNPTLRYDAVAWIAKYGARGYVSIWEHIRPRARVGSLRFADEHYLRIARREREAATWWAKWIRVWRAVGERWEPRRFSGFDFSRIVA